MPSGLVAIYPGSFDPITNGHLDLIDRGSRMAGRLIVAVLRNQAKHPLFSVEERLEMIAEVVKPYPNVEIAACAMNTFTPTMMAKKAIMKPNAIKPVIW